MQAPIIVGRGGHRESLRVRLLSERAGRASGMRPRVCMSDTVRIGAYVDGAGLPINTTRLCCVYRSFIFLYSSEAEVHSQSGS